ncbi:MAG: type II toxin-antitoxin system prevent-host-death family antitoxin [Chromatiales bacterium]|nr:type II toxin-antitoxin system prevent-host-death family antitoxin [Chromatiales bacterium]
MQTVGSYEAKTRLPELLRSVEQGESITITRRGVPIARLVGIDHGVREDTDTIIARMKRARAGRPSVSAAEILSARNHGRQP